MDHFIKDVLSILDWWKIIGDDKMSLILDPGILILEMFPSNKSFESPVHCDQVILIGSAWLNQSSQDENILPGMCFLELKTDRKYFILIWCALSTNYSFLSDDHSGNTNIV